MISSQYKSVTYLLTVINHIIHITSHRMRNKTNNSVFLIYISCFLYMLPLCNWWITISKRKSAANAVICLVHIVSQSFTSRNIRFVQIDKCSYCQDTEEARWSWLAGWQLAAVAGAWPQACSIRRELNRCNPICCCWLKRIQMMLLLGQAVMSPTSLSHSGQPN